MCLRLWPITNTVDRKAGSNSNYSSREAGVSTRVILGRSYSIHFVIVMSYNDQGSVSPRASEGIMNQVLLGSYGRPVIL